MQGIMSCGVSRKLQLTVCDNGIVEGRSCLMVKLRFRLGRFTAKPLAQHSTLKYGSDLHVNERQKIRHCHARSTEE